MLGGLPALGLAPPHFFGLGLLTLAISKISSILDHFQVDFDLKLNYAEFMSKQSIPARMVTDTYFSTPAPMNPRIAEAAEWNRKREAERRADIEAARQKRSECAAAKIGDSIAERATERHAKVSAATQREQDYRSRVARELARVMREKGVIPADARIAGLNAVTAPQQRAQDEFRVAVAGLAGCRAGYIPGDATWAEACDSLEFAEEVARG